MRVVKPGSSPCVVLSAPLNSHRCRQAKIELGSSYYNNNDSTISTFNPNPSDTDIPLQPYDPESEAGYGGGPSHQHQQWDESGRAVGYAPDPRLHAPRPRAPTFSPTALYTSPAAAAAATASQEPDAEDEWTNAKSPRTAHPPEPPAIRTKSPTSAPPLNSEAQYASFNPEHFTEGVGAVTAPARQHAYKSTGLLGSSSPPQPPVLSPPPGYR